MGKKVAATKVMMTPKMILAICICIVVLTTMYSMKMIRTKSMIETLDDDPDYQQSQQQQQQSQEQPPLLLQPHQQQVLGVDTSSEQRVPNHVPRRFAPVSRPTPKPQLTSEELEAEERIKKEQAIANEAERKVLVQRVFQEVLDEREMISAIQADKHSTVKLPQYAVLPSLPFDYRPLDQETDQQYLLDNKWKLKKELNPFLLQKPHIFVHIAKTAGSSLGNIFKRNERRDQFSHYWVHPGKHELEFVAGHKSTIFGHIRFGLHFYYRDMHPNRVTLRDDGLNPYSYMTMMREPVDRVISHYYYHRQNKRDPGHALAMKYTLQEWLERSPAANNEQARMLCGVAPPEYIDNESLTETCAHHHLKYTYKFVGLTEKFPESLVLLTHYAGFQAIRFSKINTGTQRPSVSEVPVEIVEEIKRRNYMDIELYNIAKEMFEMQIDAIGREFVEREVKEFRKRIKVLH
ncbi:hypothetical protein SAMD00019534_021990 [Acytostelium subglobosum LB1]|uniref:hypothetical protein n=1 Tax=Acytostelium subglobosum LB1 TaxID=1410327 RepID=UPI0006449D57|nr:hypothetical protein SAMD00019534_021990 [Acytostelium subglobosum LB1]GAM19024.1 hypothetical protein SAMD00019534_021990 [Acytostelium subglobosum LB1]|eukprot:XP_012756951.1 hypothetical protein SAMD00019534_021990 [Acytostelium subglobosum LB1]